MLSEERSELRRPSRSPWLSHSGYAAYESMPLAANRLLAPNASKVRIVADQVGQLPALLDQVAARETGDLLFKVPHAEHLAQDVARVVKAQCLVEIAR